MAEEVVPDHVLELVVDRLNLPDWYRFGLVCKTRKSVCDSMQFQNYLPWLIVPFVHIPNPLFEDDPLSNARRMAFVEDDVIGFFNLTDNKTYKAEIPELLNRRICASCPGGWLITVHENSQVQLFNPFTSSSSCKGKVIHHLPPLTQFPLVYNTIEKKQNQQDVDIDASSSMYYTVTRWDAAVNLFVSGDPCYTAQHMRDHYIHKVAMSSSRVASGTIIMAIQGIGKSLAFYRIGGDQHIWTSVSLDMMMEHCMLDDLTFLRGKFYAVDVNCCVFRVHGLPNDEQEEQERPVLSIEQIIDNERPIRYANHGQMIYWLFLELLCSGMVVGELKSQDHYYWRYPYKTVAFRVFKLDFGTPKTNWVQIKSIGELEIALSSWDTTVPFLYCTTISLVPSQTASTLNGILEVMIWPFTISKMVV